MGPRDVKSSFDRMFDFNRDGKLDASEQAMQFEYMDREDRELMGLDDDYNAIDDEDDDDYDDDDYSVGGGCDFDDEF